VVHAAAVRAAIVDGDLPPERFRAALQAVPRGEREAWVDLVLGLAEPLPDGSDLPRGSAPNLPCAVDAVLHALDLAEVSAHDVLVDVGSGDGRVALLARLATGAAAIGVEIQAHLAEASRALVAALRVPHVSIVHGDATELARDLAPASVFFLYCPFSGAPLERLIDAIEPIARTKTVRICAVDLALPSRPWLEPIASPRPDVVVVRSR
jgi:protein-L-isoaspartate O-methyltransferase